MSDNNYDGPKIDEPLIPKGEPQFSEPITVLPPN